MEKLYRKIGRKYVETIDCTNLGEGLWLITNKPFSKETNNILYAVKTHDIQNVGKFADFYNAHKDKLQDLIKVEYDKFFSTNKSFSISDLTNCIISALSKVKD
jgi:hypothetical protein